MCHSQAFSRREDDALNENYCKWCCADGQHNKEYNVVVCHCDGKITFTAPRIIMGENLRTIQLYFYVAEKENEIIKERMKESWVINLSHYLRKMAISGNIIHLDMTDIRAVSRLLILSFH